MQTEQMRILEMLQEGKITAEEALRLLEALGKSAAAVRGLVPPIPPTPPVPPTPPTPPTPPEPPGMPWGAFGRELAARISRSVQQAISKEMVEEEGEETGPARVNYSPRGRLTRNALSRMQDGTHYMNFGQLIIQEDVPEDLVRQKITGFTNFGWVTGPEPVITYLEEICDRNFGGFGRPGEEPGEATAGDRSWTRHARPHPHSPMAAATSTMSWEVEGIDQVAVTCHSGNLEFAGGEDDTVALDMSRLTQPGETLPEDWPASVPLEVQREGSTFHLIIGERGNPKATDNMTFRVTVPEGVSVTAETAGGSMSAESIEEAVNLKTRGGDVECREIGGDVTVDTAGGSVSLHEIKGSVNAKTAGGDVQCSEVEGDISATSGGGNLLFSEIEGSLNARTGGGNIQVSEVEGDVTIDTGGGDIQFSEVEGSVRSRTGGGNISGSETEGDVNADTGGGDISLSEVEGSVSATSGAGNITISEVEGDANAKTGSGDISFSTVAGSVRGRTGHGDINVEEVEGDADVKTPSGDIHLSGVSGSVSMNREK